MTQPSCIATSAMGSRLALAAELPPRPWRAAVRVGDGRDEGVEQARVVPPAVERAEPVEELLRVAPAQVVDGVHVEAAEHARHRGADVGDGQELTGHDAGIVAHAAPRDLEKTAVRGATPRPSAVGGTPASARQSCVKCAWSAYPASAATRASSSPARAASSARARRRTRARRLGP